MRFTLDMWPSHYYLNGSYSLIHKFLNLDQLSAIIDAIQVGPIIHYNCHITTPCDLITCAVFPLHFIWWVFVRFKQFFETTPRPSNFVWAAYFYAFTFPSNKLPSTGMICRAQIISTNALWIISSFFYDMQSTRILIDRPNLLIVVDHWPGTYSNQVWNYHMINTLVACQVESNFASHWNIRPIIHSSFKFPCILPPHIIQIMLQS